MPRKVILNHLNTEYSRNRQLETKNEYGNIVKTTTTTTKNL